MTEERPNSIGDPETPIPNVGLDSEVRIEMDDFERVLIRYHGEDFEVVATDDGLELREASDEK